MLPNWDARASRAPPKQDTELQSRQQGESQGHSPRETLGNLESMHPPTGDASRAAGEHKEKVQGQHWKHLASGGGGWAGREGREETKTTTKENEGTITRRHATGLKDFRPGHVAQQRTPTFSRKPDLHLTCPS